MIECICSSNRNIIRIRVFRFQNIEKVLFVLIPEPKVNESPKNKYFGLEIKLKFLKLFLSKK